MSLEQGSAIAQIVGAVVGIRSLIFVGIQLKLATKAVRASSSQAHAATFHALSEREGEARPADMMNDTQGDDGDLKSQARPSG
jgi:hypothetical protein